MTLRADRKMLLSNKAWAKEKVELRADYFTRMQYSQKPEVLWIGCSDSRVPAEEVTGAQPGDLFVHRNVANLVVHTDLNLISVLQYAVEVLGVPHIVICGHYGCGGMKAALSRQDFGLINKWLRSIKDVYRIHSDELDAIADEEERLNRATEWNVIEQAKNLASTALIQQCWSSVGRPHIHGWVYNLKNGLLKELISIEPASGLESLEPIYRFVKSAPAIPAAADLVEAAERGADNRHHGPSQMKD